MVIRGSENRGRNKGLFAEGGDPYLVLPQFLVRKEHSFSPFYSYRKSQTIGLAQIGGGFCFKPLVWPESGSGFASNHWFGLNRGAVLLQTIGLTQIGGGFCFKPLVWPESGSGFASNHWFGSNRGSVLLQTTWFDPNRRSVLLQTTWFDPNRRSVLLQTTWFGSNRGRVLLQKQYRFWVLYVRKAKTLLPPEGEQGLEVRLATGVAAEASSLRPHFFIPFERLHGQEDAEAEYEWKNEHLHRVESHNEFAAIVQDIEERHDGG